MTSAMQDPQLFLIFWGNYWATSQGQLDQTTLTSGVQTILSSPFLGAGTKDGMVQYGSDGQATLAGTYADTTTQVGPGTQEVVSMSDVNTFINNTILAGYIPDPSHVSHDPIYAVITEPGASLDIGGGGYNQLGTFTDGTSIHMIWVGTANPTGSILADSFTGVFSHELVEGMSYDINGIGAGVFPPNSPPPPTNLDGGNPFKSEQIADMEAGFYGYRLGGPGGPIVTSYFSNVDHGDFAVPDGNLQQMILDGTGFTVTTNPDGTTKASFGRHYDLTIQGDQFGSGTNDVLTINATFGGVQVTLNGESFFFDANLNIIDNIHINLGDGNDVVNIDGLTGQTVTIDLGTGNDTVNIGDKVANLGAIQGNISVNGGYGSDTLIVNDKHSSFLESWNVSGSTISRSGSAAINYKNIANLVLNAGVGNNFFTLSPTNKNLDELPSSYTALVGSTSASITINGGSGTNTLTLDDQNIPFPSQWTVTGSNVTRWHLVPGSQIAYLSTSINYSSVANLVIHGGKGGNSIILSPTKQNLTELPGTVVLPRPIGGGQDSTLTIDGGTGTNTLILDDQSNSSASNWLVSGNTVTREYGTFLQAESTSIKYSNVANLVLNTGQGNNSITLSPTAQNLDELPGLSVSSLFSTNPPANSITVNGGAGANTLVIDDQNNPSNSGWSVSGNGLTRSYIRPGFFVVRVTSAIKFSHITSLVLHGGKANDTFTLSPTAQDLDELLGTHRLPLSLLGSPTSLTIDGGAGSNSIVFDDRNNPFNSTWNVTSNSVNRSYRRVLGFFFETISTSIAYSNVTNLTLNGGKGNNTFVISSTSAGSRLTVNGGPASNKLVSDNANHTFTITGHDAGSYANVHFANVGSLTGGTGVDSFQFAAAGLLDGAIDGGGGGDWLDYSSFGAPVTVDLATGSATAVAGGISNIQNVIGSAGNDTLTGNALGSILIGGAGTNVITGGSGRSLLIGGTGSSVLTGGSDDDILIAGTTTFDANEAALMSILKEWQRTDRTYAERIKDLRKGGGFNGSNKLVLGKTVLDNDKASLLTGGPGQDWFFADLGATGITDLITDRVKTGPLAEVVN
jgi:hypothetical protein